MTEVLILSSQDTNALNRLRKYRKLVLCEDGFYRALGRCYWSLEANKIHRLVALGLCRLANESGCTVAWVKRPHARFQSLSDGRSIYQGDA